MKERLSASIRREQIAEAALAIVVEQGVGALTARNVAKRVGVTAPALYRHYKNKADILASIIDYVDDVYSQNLIRAKSELRTPLAVLRHIFQRNIWFIQQYKALPVLFLSDLLWFEEPQLGERLRHNLQKYRTEIANIINQGQEIGQIRNDMEPDELFVTFLSMYATLSTMVSRPIGDINLAKQAEVNWKLFEEAISV